MCDVLQRFSEPLEVSEKALQGAVVLSQEGGGRLGRRSRQLDIMWPDRQPADLLVHWGGG
eukprot:scaffold83970_cov35-Prasinocladus_malaysianus.AAC.2